MNKHILVISQYFYPEEFRINDICKEWVNRGYKVTVVTGIPNYPQGKFYKGYNYSRKRKEVYQDIEVIRLPIIPRGNNSIMLVMNYLSFVISGFFWQLTTKIDPDLVFVFEVSPMTQALPAVWYARKKKKPLILYVQDLWPDNVEFVTGIKNKLVINPLDKMVDYIYKNTDLILTTSESFRETIVSRGIHKKNVKYWPQYAEDFYIPLQRKYNTEIIQDNRFNITFTGNIGVAQGLQLLPEAANLLIEKGHSDIRFNIIGDGRYKNDFIKHIKREKLENYFVFIDRMPAKEIPKHLAMSDAGYLSFEDNELFNKTIPAKLQSYLASGIPVIASASGETKEIIDSANAGVCSPTGDVGQLVTNIIEMKSKDETELNLMRKNARNYYQKEFDKESLLDTFDKYYESLLN